MRHQRGADWIAKPTHHVHHAGRQQFSEQLRQHQRAQRGLLRRLEHHGVAGRDRRGNLPGGHHQRIVPGCDRRHHADRIATHETGVARQVLASQLAVLGARGAGKKPEHVGDRRDLVVEHRLQRFAGVVRFQGGVVLRLGLDADPRSSAAARSDPWAKSAPSHRMPAPRRLPPHRPGPRLPKARSPVGSHWRRRAPAVPVPRPQAIGRRSASVSASMSSAGRQLRHRATLLQHATTCCSVTHYYIIDAIIFTSRGHRHEPGRLHHLRHYRRRYQRHQEPALSPLPGADRRRRGGGRSGRRGHRTHSRARTGHRRLQHGHPALPRSGETHPRQQGGRHRQSDLRHGWLHRGRRPGPGKHSGPWQRLLQPGTAHAACHRSLQRGAVPAGYRHARLRQPQFRRRQPRLCIDTELPATWRRDSARSGSEAGTRGVRHRQPVVRQADDQGETARRRRC